MALCLIIPFSLMPLAAKAHPADQTPAAMITKSLTTNNDSAAQAWQTIIDKYLVENSPDNDPNNDKDAIARFDYARLKAQDEDRSALTHYIHSLKHQKPSQMNADAATAYWANLYNALTIDLVLDHYPVKSIRDIGKNPFKKGPWKQKIITIEGKKLSLDNIEHDILRHQYPSPFLHYMLNCASLGCPNLNRSLWRADSLKPDQHAAAKAYIRSSRGLSVMPDGSLAASSIYQWFKKDFGQTQAQVLEHMLPFANPAQAAAIKAGSSIKHYHYDWSLNDIR